MNENATGSPEQWLSEHGSALYKYALIHTRDKYRAEEAVQETLLAALQSYERFAGGSSMRTWLIGILKHKIMDMFRRDSREVQLDEPDNLDDADDTLHDGLFNQAGRWQDKPARWGNPEGALERDQFMIVLQKCLDAQPQRLSRVFWLREVMEENTDNICKELAITPSNLWTMLYRVRVGLRHCMDKNWVA